MVVLQYPQRAKLILFFFQLNNLLFVVLYEKTSGLLRHGRSHFHKEEDFCKLVSLGGIIYDSINKISISERVQAKRNGQ